MLNQVRMAIYVVEKFINKAECESTIKTFTMAHELGAVESELLEKIVARHQEEHWQGQDFKQNLRIAEARLHMNRQEHPEERFRLVKTVPILVNTESGYCQMKYDIERVVVE